MLWDDMIMDHVVLLLILLFRAATQKKNRTFLVLCRMEKGGERCERYTATPHCEGISGGVHAN